MKSKNKYFLYLAIVFSCLSGICAISCSDDIPADKYYTFTGEMLSDYLKERPQFTEFVKIINRSQYSVRGVNLMDLISTYGQFTCFAPDNDAVKSYLKENGYSSVEDIPYDICDTIARTHLVNGRAFGTEDLIGLTSLSSVNMNDRYIQLQEAYAYVENGDTIYTADSLEMVGKDDIHTTYRLNRSGFMYFDQCNDSVENGMVHTVNAVIASSNQSVSDLIDENPLISLFSQAMQITGIAEYIQGHIKDSSWDPDLYEDKSVYSGAQWDYCHIPETKNFGFTVFACPDSVLREKYQITDLQSFYDYARSIYGGDELDVNDEANAEALQDWRSPLRRLIGYNILKQSGSYDNLTSITTIETTSINPTEWYATLDSLTTIKIERLTVTKYIANGETRNELYLNRGDKSRGCETAGIHVSSEVGGEYENNGANGWYFITDGLADYGETTKQDIFNTRMRMDLYYMFPELMSNNIRDGRTANYIAQSNNPDKNVASPNYWFPNGYLDNVKVNDDGIFLFQSQHNTYWSYEGDEFNLASDVNSYDITFNLPSVPSGTYQIRLGFAPMSTRGICQFYLDGEPQGIPFDMRDTNFTDRTGWFALSTAVSSGSYTSDEVESMKKNMHNLGWYHGPMGVSIYQAEGIQDGTNASRTKFCDIMNTMRYVLCTANLDENVQHTVRIKSIWAVGTALVMIDYLELVPKSVYGVEGEGKAEDDY
ncbi:MAG: fasciclin domain-containing protein [Prevotellaceae bacterium]|nr:fasciclin domain-containing protein [Prevotellaceae bacterium]